MSESAAPVLEEPASKRAKISEPEPQYRDELYAIIVYDFEARGESTGSTVSPFNACTLASIGASWFIVHFRYGKKDEMVSCWVYFPAKSDAAQGALGNSAPGAFSDTFPTIFTDEQWAKMPLSASPFWDKHPKALSALKENGHVVKDAEEVYSYMSASAKRFQSWLKSIQAYMSGIGNKSCIIVATATASSDSKRLASYMGTAGLLSPPYDSNGKYNGVREWNYDQLIQALRLVGKAGEPDFNSPLIPVQRNHVALDDAITQSFEAFWTLLWAVTDEKEFEELKKKYTENPSANPEHVVGADRAQVLKKYLSHL
jgi:hypothetical protein